MIAKCGKTVPHPKHPVWINGGAHPPIECPGIPDPEDVRSSRTCKEAVWVWSTNVGCQVVEPGHRVHLGYYGKIRIEWTGPVGQTQITPPEIARTG